MEPPRPSLPFFPAARLVEHRLPEVTVELHAAVRADAVAEIGLGVRPKVRLQVLPVARVVADLLAVGADWDQPPQGLDLLECLLEPGDERRLRLPGPPEG